MGILDKLSALVHEPVEEQSSTDTWPKETEEYWEDNSINKYELPPTAVLDDKWAPTADQVVPGYRGTEEHGVPYDASENYIVPLDQRTADANEAALRKAHEENLTVTEEYTVQPIPVDVVSMPTPIARQNRLGINRFDLTKGDLAGGDPIRIAPQSHRREVIRMRLYSANDAIVTIHTDPQAVKSVGYPVSLLSGELELHTTEALYAYMPPVINGNNTTTLAVMEEFSVETDEQPV